jgi:hypothetical protein
MGSSGSAGQPNPSPDVVLQSKATTTSAKWTAIAAIIVAILSVATNIIQAVDGGCIAHISPTGERHAWAHQSA